MALPFLPEDQISRAFRKLKRKAATRPLQELAEYVENTWITSTTWPPASWSVYLQAVRTNNDVEGWHYGLNRRAQGKSQLPLYMLIMLLHEESRLTSLQIRLVSDKKLCRIQRKTYRQAAIQNLHLMGPLRERREVCRATAASVFTFIWSS